MPDELRTHRPALENGLGIGRGIDRRAFVGVGSARDRIAPTTGAGVVLAIALGALPAALVGLEFAWLVVIAALTILAVAPWLAWREVRAVSAVAPPPSLRVHAGRATPVTFDFRVRRSCRDLLADVSVEGAGDRERDGAPKVAIEGMVPGSPVRVPLIARFGSRGTAVHLLLRITSTFPFGLFVATRKLVLPSIVRVLPRLQPRADAALAAVLQEPSPSGASRARLQHLTRTGLPIGLRSARQGDRLRDIAWKPSLRQSRWVAFDREGQEVERHVTVVLQLGVRGSSSSSLRRTGLAFESAVSHCATAIEWLFSRTGSVRLEFSSTPADAPLHVIARGSVPEHQRAAGRGVRGGAAHGPSTLMDRLSDIKINPAHGPRDTLSPSGAPAADELPGPEPKGPDPLGPKRLDQNLGHGDSDLRIVFVGMSALEYQRATDAPADSAQPGEPGALVLGVDANGRIQVLWGSADTGPRRALLRGTERRA